VSGRERAALITLAGILAITGAWWALALWPLPSDAPYWLVRTREVCFGSLPDTLPTRAGWLILIAEPLTMTAALAVIWQGELFGGLTALARSIPGRLVLALGALALVGGAAAATARIASASGRAGPGAAYVPPPPSTYPRLDRSAPPLALVDQHGDTVRLASFRGRPVLVSFAYAHCMSACPVAVREVLDAQRRLAAAHAALVIVTIDPWRDTPERLASVAAEWRLGDDAHVVSGDTTSVLRTLDAWNVPHARDLATGELAHPTFVYLVDGGGRIAYAAAAHANTIVALAGRM